MKKIYLLLLTAIVIIGFQSCSCPVEETDPVFLCETRIVTMERFNPNFTVTIDPINGEKITDLDPTYNISMFQFPDNSSSSGSSPNDSRFEGSKQLVISKEAFSYNGENYFAAIMDGYPSNELLAGDILIADVDLSVSGPAADFRIYGYIDMIDQNYANEDAQAFCDYVKLNMNDIISSANSLRENNGDNLYKWGENQTGATKSSYNNSSIVILDRNMNLLGSLGDIGMPVPDESVLNKLKSSSEGYVNLRVVPGNVYTYLAKNGKRFVFFVSEIRAASISPFRQRVSMMFYPLDK